MLAKKEENVEECCKILSRLLSLPENEELNKEIDQIVDTVKSTSNSSENNFQKQLFTSLSNLQQYELLLKVANKTTDQTNYWQLMLLILKKFPDKINEHALKLVDMLNENKSKEETYLKDYFCKLLIFDVFPLILSVESNLKLSSEQVEKLLENLFKIYFQQSSIGKVTDDEKLKIDCTTAMNKMQVKLREIFNLIRVKIGWEPFSMPDELSLNTLKEQYDKLIVFYKNLVQFPNQIDIKKLKQVFYTSFMLFLIYLDHYIKLTVSKLILIQQNTTISNLAKNMNKKRKLHEIKNAPVCTNDELQTAFSGTNKIFAFLNQDHLLQQELFRMIALVGLDKCKSYEIFIIDTYFYRGDNESLLTYFTSKNEYSLKSCVQLVNSSLITNNYSLTLEYTYKLVNMISTYQFEANESDFSTNSTKNSTTNSKIIAENEKCQLTFVNYNKSDVLSYAIDVLIKCLDELNLNTKPTDAGIGHVMVLSQYKWPSNVLFFVKCLNLIKSNFLNSKFSYPSFMQYILNTDILEEFRSLVSADNCKIELCIVKPTEPKIKTMTTRGVNKNAKEEIKNALINQMRCSKIRLDDDLFINFIINELKDFTSPVKKTRR